MHVVAAATQADADAEPNILDGVVVDFSVEGLEDGNPGVLHVVDVVVCLFE